MEGTRHAHRFTSRGLAVISVESLTKSYRGVTAVDNVTFCAESGRVTGFLGPNGAGKSTTMRMIVGLTQPTSGRARLSGSRYADQPNPGMEVGVLLDASAQHAGRTGRETLTLAQRTVGMPSRRVDEVLSVVSLTGPEADRRVSNYSLGMRQRLGLAVAMIGNPAILILDEPANGLDPAGIRWMRDLLRRFADAGGTVLLSSHLLHEIEIVADDIVVIGQGQIVARGTKSELLKTAGSMVRATDLARLQKAMAAGGVSTSPAKDGTLRAEANPERVGALAYAAGVAISELRPADGDGLEEMFLKLTADTQRDGALI